MFKIKSVLINPTGTYSMKKETANLYRIYKNPNAKDLFIKAQNAETIEERRRLFDEMGEYEIVNETPKKRCRNRVIQFLKGIFSNN